MREIEKLDSLQKEVERAFSSSQAMKDKEERDQ